MPYLQVRFPQFDVAKNHDGMELIAPRYRARHVKCGEEKPQCLRCRDSGRVCDGFPEEGQTLSGSLVPGISSPQSARERRYLDYFRQRTIPDLSGYDTQSHFWNYVVLQASHSSPAVLHGALALGALHEQMDTGSPSVSNEKINRFLLQQANKSIRSLCTHGSSPPVQVALICCILFICLGNAQGDHEGALRHLQSGLSMLEEWRLQGKSVDAGTRAQEVFAQMFCRLDIQATTFLDSRQPRLHTNAFSEVPAYLAGVPKSFENLHDAQIALESIEIRSFYSLTSKLNNSSKEVLLQGLESRFDQWHQAFEALLAQNPSMQTNDLQLAVLLKLHHKVMSLMLRVKAEPVSADSAELDAKREVEFDNILSAAKSLITSSAASNSSSFTAETGVIAPLYFTAMNAQSPGTKKEAIELLSKWKRREGFWDPEIAAKIAGTVIEFTEAGVPDLQLSGGIPDLVKIYGTAMS